jgi:hypothetical protein
MVGGWGKGLGGCWEDGGRMVEGWDLLQIQEEDAACHQRKMTKFAAPK